MHISFIKPNMLNTNSRAAMQPLFAAALKAVTPDDIECVLYDDRLESIPFDTPTDLAAISIETYSARRAYEIAAAYIKRGVTVVAGGFHPSLLAEETLQFVDSVVIGDAELSWPVLIDDFRKGKLKKIYNSSETHKESKILFDRSIFQGKNYGPVEMVQWGRGCPHNCDFCSIKAFYQSNQYCRSIDEVIEEISGLKKKTVFFVDDNLYHNKKLLKEFLRALKGMGIRWCCQISINITQDNEILKLMKESGCFMVVVGIESFNHQNLEQMNKQWNTAGLDYDSAIQKINAHGIMIYGTFIFGYDYDTTESFQKALDFAMKHKFFIANFNPLNPMPGTELYKRLAGENRLVYERWWIDPDFYYGKSMFSPKGMTIRELEDYTNKMKTEFNSLPSILLRLSNPLITHKSINKTLLYLYANMVNRKEVFRTQGKQLGL